MRYLGCKTDSEKCTMATVLLLLFDLWYVLKWESKKWISLFRLYFVLASLFKWKHQAILKEPSIWGFSSEAKHTFMWDVYI